MVYYTQYLNNEQIDRPVSFIIYKYRHKVTGLGVYFGSKGNQLNLVY